MAASLAALLALAPAAGAQLRAFELRSGQNVQGDITIAANTLLECPVTTPSCDIGGMSANEVPNANNNGRLLSFVDVDADPTTPNSSSAQLNLPGGASAVAAYLYWGGRVPAGFDPANMADVDDFLSVKLETPAGGGYQDIVGFQLDGRQTEPTWQGIADVTAEVQAGGAGTYTVADVALRELGTGGPSSYGGWSLVVAYEDTTMTQPWRNLSIFDGFAVVGSTQNILVSGFVTPPTGPVNTSAGFVAYEGDWGSGGDQTRIDGVNLFDALTPTNNFFNARITRLGVDVGDRNPNFLNQLGYDSKLVDASNIIPNGATSATVTVTSAAETYFPGVITTAIDLFVPLVIANKQVANITNPGAVTASAGDILEYTVSYANDDSDPNYPVDGADDFMLTDAIPANTTYVPGSLAVTAGPNAPATPTDADGDDIGEYDGVGDQVVFRLGTGANATDGGTVAPGETVTITFRVQIDAGTAPGTEIDNAASAFFLAATLRDEHVLPSNVVLSRVAAAAAGPPPAGAAQQRAARLTGPAGCVKGKRARYFVRGSGIRQVRWFLNGKRIATQRRRDSLGSQRFRKRVGGKGLRAGKNKLRAVVRFDSSAGGGVRRLNRTVQRCRPSAPSFTG